jgi:GT2 family glycosyltransferase
MHFPTLTRAIQEFWFGKKVYSKYAPQESYPIPVDAVVGAAFLVTPYAIEKVGLLDERYFMYFEDLDYCRRVWKAGLKVYYLPQAQIIHYHGVSGRKLAPKSMQWKRLVPSSKIYHGLLKHYLLTLIILFGQKVLRKIA